MTLYLLCKDLLPLPSSLTLSDTLFSDLVAFQSDQPSFCPLPQIPPFSSQNFHNFCSLYLNYSSPSYLHDWLLSFRSQLKNHFLEPCFSTFISQPLTFRVGSCCHRGQLPTVMLYDFQWTSLALLLSNIFLSMFIFYGVLGGIISF